MKKEYCETKAAHGKNAADQGMSLVGDGSGRVGGAYQDELTSVD